MDLLHTHIPVSWWVVPSLDLQPSMEQGFSGMKGSEGSKNSANRRNQEREGNPEVTQSNSSPRGGMSFPCVIPDIV